MPTTVLLVGPKDAHRQLLTGVFGAHVVPVEAMCRLSRTRTPTARARAAPRRARRRR